MALQSQGFGTGTGQAPGPLVAAEGLALVVNVVGLFTFTGVALCVFGYIGLTLWLTIRATRQSGTSTAVEVGSALLGLSWIAALVGGVAVGALHWTSYPHAAYAVLGLYASAVLVWVFGRVLNMLWSMLLPGFGLALLTAVVRLGAPPGADDMEKAENWTPVAVTVVDEAGEPVDGATVYFDLVHLWQSDPEFDGDDREWWTKCETDAQGIARTSLEEDPRFKRLVIRVRHSGFTGGYNEPTTIAAYVGHEDARREVTLPAPKVPYLFDMEMKTRPHPDSAFLAVELDAPGGSSDGIARSLKLVLATEENLPRADDPGSVDRLEGSDRGIVRSLYLSNRGKIVFQVDRESARGPLTLLVLERDASRYDDAYLKLLDVNVGIIEAGGSRKLPSIDVPARIAATPGSSPGMR